MKRLFDAFYLNKNTSIIEYIKNYYFRFFVIFLFINYKHLINYFIKRENLQNYKLLF